MFRIHLILSLMIFIFAGCSTFPKDDIQVVVDADPKVNLHSYKTYAWLGSVGIINDPQGQWEPPRFDADAEIAFQIDKALRGRGLTEVEESPDLLVAYSLGLDMEALKLKQDPETKLSALENAPQTGLVVLLVDPDTSFVVWAGVASAEFKNLEPEVAQQRLQYVIDEMFEHFPDL